jgi:hypothetical protein
MTTTFDLQRTKALKAPMSADEPPIPADEMEVSNPLSRSSMIHAPPLLPDRTCLSAGIGGSSADIGAFNAFSH